MSFSNVITRILNHLLLAMENSKNMYAKFTDTHGHDMGGLQYSPANKRIKLWLNTGRGVEETETIYVKRDMMARQIGNFIVARLLRTTTDCNIFVDGEKELHINK